MRSSLSTASELLSRQARADSRPLAPPPARRTPDLSTRRAKDPLQSLTGWRRGEHVLDLTSPSSDNARYSVVHNLHALAPEHCMLVPFFDPDGEGPHPFRPQTSGLTEDDLWTAWRVVRAYAEAGRETTAFFKCVCAPVPRPRPRGRALEKS